MTRILVTGGAGFIGSHIVDSYVDQGYDVTVVDNLTEQTHNGKPTYLNESAEYVWGDIRDQSLMSQLLKKADILNHQASIVGVGQSMYEIEQYTDINTLATARMLDIIANDGIDLERMIVASSMSIYGEGLYRCPSCEEDRATTTREMDSLGKGEWNHYCHVCNTSLTPVGTPESKQRSGSSIYAITKKTQEEMMRSAGQTYDIPTVALRYFNTYGPRQSLDNPYTGVCAIFANRIHNGHPPLVFEDGEQRRDFVHVSDIASANVAATEADVYNEAFNIGTGKPVKIKQIADILINQIDRFKTIQPQLTGEYRAGDIRHCYADIEKARSLLDYNPTVDIEEGLSKLVNWTAQQDTVDNFDDMYDEQESKGVIKNSKDQ